MESTCIGQLKKAAATLVAEWEEGRRRVCVVETPNQSFHAWISVLTIWAFFKFLISQRTFNGLLT